MVVWFRGGRCSNLIGRTTLTCHCPVKQYLRPFPTTTTKSSCDISFRNLCSLGYSYSTSQCLWPVRKKSHKNKLETRLMASFMPNSFPEPFSLYPHGEMIGIPVWKSRFLWAVNYVTDRIKGRQFFQASVLLLMINCVITLSKWLRKLGAAGE